MVYRFMGIAGGNNWNLVMVDGKTNRRVSSTNKDSTYTFRWSAPYTAVPSFIFCTFCHIIVDLIVQPKYKRHRFTRAPDYKLTLFSPPPPSQFTPSVTLSEHIFLALFWGNNTVNTLCFVFSTFCFIYIFMCRRRQEAQKWTHGILWANSHAETRETALGLRIRNIEWIVLKKPTPQRDGLLRSMFF